MRLIVGSIRGRYPRKPLWLLAPPRNILPIDNDSRLVSTMIPILFHLGPLTVYSYGLMMALGFLAADYVIRLECIRRGLDPEYSSSIVIAAAVAGLIGSRIYAILDDLPTYLADPKSMIFSGSGFVFYGGMIGGLIGAYLVSRWYRISFSVTMCMCAPRRA